MTHEQATWEESDNIIVQQIINISREPSHGDSMISDDIDAILLALYHFKE